MDNEIVPQKVWEHLLSSGGYSIGFFSVTVMDNHVRVFHYRTKKVHHFPKENSYEEMEKLCQQRGYDLPYLLNNYYPKSFRSLRTFRENFVH